MAAAAGRIPNIHPISHALKRANHSAASERKFCTVSVCFIEVTTSSNHWPIFFPHRPSVSTIISRYLLNVFLTVAQHSFTTVDAPSIDSPTFFNALSIEERAVFKVDTVLVIKKLLMERQAPSMVFCAMTAAAPMAAPDAPNASAPIPAPTKLPNGPSGAPAAAP